MLKFLFVFALAIFSTTANAAWLLVEDATITRLTNSANNTDTYTLSTTGGTGLCANVPISFPSSVVSNPEIHKRGFSVALTAFSTGQKVKIYSYIDNQCNNAGFIEVTK